MDKLWISCIAKLVDKYWIGLIAGCIKNQQYKDWLNAMLLAIAPC